MFKIRAIECSSSNIIFVIVNPKYERLFRVDFNQTPNDISIGLEEEKEYLPNPLKQNQIFEAIIVTMETGFLLLIDGQLIKEDIPYTRPLNNDYYIYILGGCPVLEIDFKKGTNWT